MVARERSSSAVRAVHARRQSNNQETRFAVAERRHRFAVVIRVALVDVVEELREPRAGAAGCVEHRQLVAHVANDGPAEAAGLQPGDIIVRIDDIDIVELVQLLNLVAARSPGESLRIQVLRDGKPLTLVARVTERPAEETP